MSNNNLPEGKIMEKSIPGNWAKKKSQADPDILISNKRGFILKLVIRDREGNFIFIKGKASREY